MENNANLDSWEGIVDNYLKAEDLTEDKGAFVVDDVMLINKTTDSGETTNQIRLKTTIDEKEYLFALNYTNSKIVKGFVKSPKELLGKRVYWEKIKVRNPTTNKTQDGISVVKVE